MNKSRLASPNLLGVRVSPVTMPLALDRLAAWVDGDARQYVCVANTHLLVECYRSPRLRAIHNRAGMVTPDGMPLVWLSRLQGFRHVERVYGPDLLLAACERSLETGHSHHWSHFFYGGAPGVAERLVQRLTERYPGLKIAGTDTPPFRPLTPEEDQAAVERINASGADLLWVGLGAPKQEYWMAEHLGRIQVPVMLGVGAAFDFHAGLKTQAPRWMQRSGLEWLFRLASEPKRLWKRYLVNNPLFVWLVLLQILGLKHFPIDPPPPE